MRWLSAWGAKPRLAAVFHDEYVLGLEPMGPHAMHDPQRPAKIRRALLERPYRKRVTWIEPPLVTEAELERVHPATYLEYASQPAFIGQILGLHSVHPWDTELWTS